VNLINWHRAGEDVERELPVFSTFLGHTNVRDTCWAPLLPGIHNGHEDKCRVALYWDHPQFVWRNGSIRALSKFGPARSIYDKLSDNFRFITHENFGGLK